MSVLPSLSALRCFDASARHGSFTLAAQEVHLTQSAVSKQVAQLEDMLRHHLFLRIRRRLQLTPAGSLYLADTVNQRLVLMRVKTWLGLRGTTQLPWRTRVWQVLSEWYEHMFANMARWQMMFRIQSCIADPIFLFCKVLRIPNNL